MAAHVHALPATQQALKVTGPNQLALQTGCSLPVCEDDEVLVWVRCVSVNPVDAKMLDLAPIVGATAGCRMDNGSYAEYVAVPGDLVYLLPAHLSYAEGASLGAAMPTVGMALYSTWSLPLPHTGDPAKTEHALAHPHVPHPSTAASADTSAGAAPDNAQVADGAVAGIQSQTSLHQSQNQLQSQNHLHGPNHGCGRYVLVYGASTVSGALAMQMLRYSGMLPVAVCSPSNFAMATARGAHAVFDYHDPACADDIRHHTHQTLAYVLDCIADVASMKLCYAAMGTAGGRYMALNPFPLRAHTRRDIKPDYVLVYTIFGKEMKLPRPFMRPARPKDRAFAEAWYRSTQPLVDTPAAILSHPIQQGTGLAAIPAGLDRMRQAKISGTKLVYQLNNAKA
ncbi:hypothetical protein N0V95_005405 [Ascochyta clinopodiicola]|nr:hypothetical protein N0V95_005405 [Ascochyta clinopodiicola]